MFDESEKMLLVHASLKEGLEGMVELYLNVYGVINIEIIMSS
jgi:hypothetical protein